MPKNTRRTSPPPRAVATDEPRRADASGPRRVRLLPYRLLLVLVLGAALALVVAAFNVTSPLSPRAVLLLFAGVLLLLAAALEVIFRDIRPR